MARAIRTIPTGPTGCAEWRTGRDASPCSARARKRATTSISHLYRRRGGADRACATASQLRPSQSRLGSFGVLRGAAKMVAALCSFPVEIKGFAPPESDHPSGVRRDRAAPLLSDLRLHPAQRRTGEGTGSRTVRAVLIDRPAEQVATQFAAKSPRRPRGRSTPIGARTPVPKQSSTRADPRYRLFFRSEAPQSLRSTCRSGSTQLSKRPEFNSEHTLARHRPDPNSRAPSPSLGPEVWSQAGTVLDFPNAGYCAQHVEGIPGP